MNIHFITKIFEKTETQSKMTFTNVLSRWYQLRSDGKAKTNHFCLFTHIHNIHYKCSFRNVPCKSVHRRDGYTGPPRIL